MWPMLIGAGAGAGLGLLKSELIDRENERKDRLMQSVTDRYSPWTKMRGTPVAHTDALGTAVGGAAGGLQQGAAMESATSNSALNAAIAKRLGGADEMSGMAVSSAKQGAPSLAQPGELSYGQSSFPDYGAGGSIPSQELRDFDPMSVSPEKLMLLKQALENRRRSGIA